jgi:hypothetical protein
MSLVASAAIAVFRSQIREQLSIQTIAPMARRDSSDCPGAKSAGGCNNHAWFDVMEEFKPS